MTHLNTRTGGFKNGPDQGGTGKKVEYSDVVFKGDVELPDPGPTVFERTFAVGSPGNMPSGLRGSSAVSDTAIREGDQVIVSNAGAVPYWPVGVILEQCKAAENGVTFTWQNVSAGTLDPGTGNITCLVFRDS